MKPVVAFTIFLFITAYSARGDFPFFGSSEAQVDLSFHLNDELSRAEKTGAKRFHQNSPKRLVQISTTEFEKREHGFFHMHTTRYWKSSQNVEVLLKIIPELESAYKVTFKKRKPTSDDPFMKIYLYGEPIPCEPALVKYCDVDDYGRGVAFPFKIVKICSAGFNRLLKNSLALIFQVA